MKGFISLTLIFAVTVFAACDLRSGIAKDEMEKLSGTPTPPISPVPTGTPINEADIAKVDTAQEGNQISINDYDKKSSANCTKYNRLIINGDKNRITVKGVCKQIMINGDKNELTTDAAMEFVLNGSDNNIGYARFANGKAPSIVENRPGNTVEKISTEQAMPQKRSK